MTTCARDYQGLDRMKRLLTSAKSPHHTMSEYIGHGCHRLITWTMWMQLGNFVRLTVSGSHEMQGLTAMISVTTCHHDTISNVSIMFKQQASKLKCLLYSARQSPSVELRPACALAEEGQTSGFHFSAHPEAQ